MRRNRNRQRRSSTDLVYVLAVAGLALTMIVPTTGAFQAKQTKLAAAEKGPVDRVATEKVSDKPADKTEKSRIWTDGKGRKLEGAFVEVKDGNVTLRSKSGKSVVMPLDKLSEEDQKYVNQVGSVPEKSPKDPTAGDGDKAAKADDTPASWPAKVVQVSGKDYYGLFKSDSKAAVAKFDNVTVEVTGYCIGLTALYDDHKQPRFGALISGDGTKIESGDFFVCCLTGKSPWKQLAPGNEVTIRGVISKPGVFRRSRRNLVDAKVVSANAGQTPEIKAVDLAAEYAANPTAAIKKYNHKWLVVEGEFIELVAEEYDNPDWAGKYDAFVGTAKRKIYMTTSAAMIPAKEWTIGENVTVLGQCCVTEPCEIPVSIECAHRVDDFKTPQKAVRKGKVTYSDDAKEVRALPSGNERETHEKVDAKSSTEKKSETETKNKTETKSETVATSKDNTDPPAMEKPAATAPETDHVQMEKKAASMLKMAEPFIKTNPAIARRRLHDLIKRYPNTKAAAEAEVSLKELSE